MKFLLIFSLLSSMALGSDSKKEGQTAVAVEHKIIRDGKRAAYKEAKRTCLNENKKLKGNALRECIVSKNK
jgi:hypothetical protein